MDQYPSPLAGGALPNQVSSECVISAIISSAAEHATEWCKTTSAMNRERFKKYLYSRVMAFFANILARVWLALSDGPPTLTRT
jgi:hypothetical protein